VWGVKNLTSTRGFSWGVFGSIYIKNFNSQHITVDFVTTCKNKSTLQKGLPHIYIVMNGEVAWLIKWRGLAMVTVRFSGYMFMSCYHARTHSKTCLKQHLKGPEHFPAKSGFHLIKVYYNNWGYAVALWLRRYVTNLKVVGSRPRWGEWFLSSYLILLVALGPGVYSASNRNEYHKHKNNVSGE
jgi:hypothetical protein